MQCLVAQGYAGTTTLEIERRAGVSRGARIHHYPTKASLLAAAVEFLYDRLSAHYDEAFSGLDSGASDAVRFRQGLELLWSIYSQPEYAAVLELNTAARTDAELAGRLTQVADRHRLLALQTANRHFPVLSDEVSVALIETLHATLMGLRMTEQVRRDNPHRRQVMELLMQLVALHFQPPESTKE